MIGKSLKYRKYFDWTPERLAKLRETLSKPEVKANIYTPARNEKIRQWHVGKPFPGSK